MSKNTIAQSNNCNIVELETEKKVQFSHFLEFFNVDIERPMTVLAYYSFFETFYYSIDEKIV